MMDFQWRDYDSASLPSLSDEQLHEGIAYYDRRVKEAHAAKVQAIARLKALTTPTALGARSWVEVLSSRLNINRDQARRLLREVALAEP
ncbi:hypothetical protein [Mycolicibacterium wolinskyi]|uniref:hypothetical protein n=1 Tax=Mycolicibacterium wolinskyi TaxID=59750 RepID=UPI003917702E